MPPLTRAASAVAVATALLCPPIAQADPLPPVEVPTSGPEVIEVIASIASRVDVARCRRTLAEAQVDHPEQPPSPYRVQVPLLTMTRELPTPSDPNTYYVESNTISAKVPDYCPNGTKVVLWIQDAAPAGQPIYTSRFRPGRSDQPGRGASTGNTLRVPYLGPTSQRPIAYVTVHAEAWNGRDAAGRYSSAGNYFCKEFDYTILGVGLAPRQDAIRDCAGTG